MRKISLLLVFVVLSLFADAKPARPGFFRYVQPDGSTVLIRRHGDEWGHWSTDDKGRVVEKGADGFYRPVEGMTQTKAAQGAAFRREAARRQSASVPSKAPLAVGRKNFLLILVEFSDLAFTLPSPHETFDRQMNLQGYSANGASGSARDFYYENSHGVFDPVFDVLGPVKLDKEMAYYGKNDKNGHEDKAPEAVRDALLKLDGEVDFSRYDLDEDGWVDLVYMIYAGKGEADGGDDDSIWAHQWDLRSVGIDLSLDGKKLGRYACSPELQRDGSIDGIGSVCHEFGHALGLPDFYDTDYDLNGKSRTLLEYSTMDSGCYNNDSRTPPFFNIEERVILGWLEESAIREFPEDGVYTLETVDDNVAYKIPTDMEGEYFVVECRTRTAWDRYIPSPGLLVYHVDKSERQVKILDSWGQEKYSVAKVLWEDWRTDNAINENGEHPCFYVEASSAPGDVSFGMKFRSEYGRYFDPQYSDCLPFPGRDKVREYVPVSWNRVYSRVKLSEIDFVSGKATFRVQGVSASLLNHPFIANPGKGVYSAGERFQLSLVLPDGYAASGVKWLFDGKTVTEGFVILPAGRHSVEAQLSTEGGRKDTVSLEIEVK